NRRSNGRGSQEETRLGRLSPSRRAMTLRHIDSRLPTNSVELGRVEDILSSIKTAVGRSATSPNILLRPRQSVPPQRRGGRLRGARPQEALRAGRAAGPWEP